MARAKNPAQIRNREKKRDVTIAKVRRALDTSQMDGCRQVSPDKPLTDKQKAFVKFVAMGESGVNAIIKAGMSSSNPQYSSRLLAMPNIQRALAIEREAYAKASELTKRDVMMMLKDAYDMAKLMAEPASMVSAAREIGKMSGYYEPKKVEVSLTNGTKQKVEQLSNEQLYKMIEEATAEVALIEAHRGDEEDDGDEGQAQG